MTAIQKVALITAGSAGLGAQIARVLAPDFRVVGVNTPLHSLQYDMTSFDDFPLSLSRR